MRLLTPIVFVVLLSAAGHSFAQQAVESKGISANVKLQEVVYGHLRELNGNFMLRATEISFQPGAYLGAHHHAGPGIRYVASGTLTFTEGGKITIYKTGDYFFESGNIAHTAQNNTKSPLRVIFFEILPVNLNGPSVIPPKAH